MGAATDNQVLRVGDVIEGYAGGIVGAHSDVRVEAIGSDWVVLREVGGSDGEVHFAYCTPEVLLEYRK